MVGKGDRLLRSALLCLLCAHAAGASDEASAGDAGDAPPAWLRALDNDFYKISLDVRTRMELANFESFHHSSQAYTTRVRLGVGSKPLFGVSGYAELESSFAYDNDGYFDVVTLPNRRRQTPIADPSETDLNQLYLRYDNPELLGLGAIAGRQRIVLDDHRFIGNVGWRQNEQVYDALLGSTSFGLEGLTARYGYIRDVHRIFGNDGAAATRDFDSDSHFVNVSYAGFAPLRLTAFAYLLDFKSDTPGFSSNSYGARADGGVALSAEWKLGYAASYAYQVDAGRNPLNYQADYVAADGSVGFAPLGAFGVGYELLGSDGGRAVFQTPLATLHKFNGFADVFLNNGGPDGLQDLYAYLAPKLPWKLSGRLVYHHFWSDEDGTVLGEEVDFVVSRPITPWLSVLSKGALFESKSQTLADGWRYWLEFTIAY